MMLKPPRKGLMHSAIFLAIGAIGILSAVGFVTLFDRARQVSWPWESVTWVAPNVVPTTFHPLRVSSITVPGTRWGSAGAIDALGTEIFLVTRAGVFLRYVREKPGHERLPIPSPTNLQALLENYDGEEFRTSFGVKDLLVTDAADRISLYATFHFWKEREKCYVLRLGRYQLPKKRAVEGGRGGGEWETLFETRPCIPTTAGNYPLEAGGRLAFLEDNILLMTVGDHNFNRSTYVQDEATSYGKILKIDVRSGQSEIYSIGHRNPQGLFVSRTGVVWETEHGPKGGDELNLISAGGNYGWPLRTYGAAYGAYTWPLSDEQGSHGDYQHPFLAWSPSIGISNLLVVKGTEFPTWTGDLLVGTLRATSLFRIRVRGRRVTLVEKISLGRRLRDIVEMDDGAIVLLTDSESDGGDGKILILENAANVGASGSSASVESNEQVLARYPSLAPCAACHALGEGMAHGLGPNLWGIIGREIGAAPGYEYSSTLSTLSRTWTEQRIRDFLADPVAFAPGSAMPMQGDLDEAAIDGIVRALRSLH